ncbi:hypothetical protein [Corallococcus sp. CA047B]|uniref:hypothetical protein n=1 Tax=Corallococcus sp. CA047B TaxID=2316729 RepID=UPI0011C475A2|nr:hypothetical protein [Corallococcus sp. CA047B]
MNDVRTLSTKSATANNPANRSDSLKGQPTSGAARLLACQFLSLTLTVFVVRHEVASDMSGG